MLQDPATGVLAKLLLDEAGHSKAMLGALAGFGQERLQALGHGAVEHRLLRLAATIARR
jgi:hypothetical protein